MITKIGRKLETEPKLERLICDNPEMETPEGRYKLAREMFRWAKQLYKTGDIIAADNSRADELKMIVVDFRSKPEQQSRVE